MEEPLVSIIVPIYNVEEYIEECVDSILNQTYQNIEVILVNDGSPDRCGEICEEYSLKDQRIRVIHKENGGLSDARNAGLDICQGEFISFVDSDDTVLSTFIEVLYQNLVQYKADLSVIGSYRNANEIINHVGTRVNFYPNYLDFLYDSTIKDWKVEVWRKLYKREIWESLRFPVGKKSEDTFIFPYIVYQRKIVYSDAKLYYYRINPKSIMASFDDSVAENANEAFKINIDFFNMYQPEYSLTVITQQIQFNYTYYLRFRLYNQVCKQFLLKNKKTVLKVFPFKTSLKLFGIIFLRSLFGLDKNLCKALF